MINIIITVDYEIFGNGTGDFKEHVINPMDRILDICDKHSVSISIMFEVMEYIAVKKYDDQLREDLGYSPKEKMEEQINRAYSNGHDIQLHIHPQFRNMKYNGKKFVLDENLTPYLELESSEVENILKKGKKTLESVIEDENYTSEALRLSNIGWRKVPENTVDPMKKLGLKIHSLSDEIPKNEVGYWKIKEDVYEIPIHSTFVNLFQFVNPRKLFIYLYIWLHTGLDIFSIDEREERSKEKTISSEIKSKWDFSKLTCKEMMKYIELGKNRYDYNEFEVPLVMIGHTKDFFNEGSFERFLKKIERKNSKVMGFETLEEFGNDKIF